jgi:flavin-dependent dehydrogenase
MTAGRDSQEARTLPGSYDVVVVGARAAGAATAFLLARKGLSVLVLDRSEPGADTLSTHALTRGAVVLLHRWGVLGAVLTHGTPPIRRTTFHYGEETQAVDIKPRDGVDALYAPRRTVLDPILVEAARGAGADVRHGCRITSLLRNDAGHVDGVSFVDAESEGECRANAVVTIGADGVRSIVAREAGAATYWSRPEATAMVYGYFQDPGVDGYHWFYESNATAGIIPTNDDQVCTWVGTPSDRFRKDLRGDPAAAFGQLLAEAAPDLTDTFPPDSAHGRLFGYAGQPGYMRQSWGPGWALVGDAGYFKDPLTAHGITDALRDAECLARAIAADFGSDHEDSLFEYQERRDQLSAEFAAVTSQIASYEWDMQDIKALVRKEGRLLAAEAQAIADFGPL